MPNTNTKPKLLSTKQAARLLGVSPRQLRRWVKERKVTAIRRGFFQYFNPAEVEQFKQALVSLKPSNTSLEQRSAASQMPINRPVQIPARVQHTNDRSKADGLHKGMARLMLLIVTMVLALLLISTTHSSPLAVTLMVLVVASLALLGSLKRFLPGTASLSTLMMPEGNTAFAQGAPTGQNGEVLISYRIYATLRRRLGTSLILILGLGTLALIGLQVLPVPTAAVALLSGAVILAIASFALFSLLSLVPRKQRLATLKSFISTDPRVAFARYAPTEGNGALKVGYTTYKRLYRTATITVTTLLVLLSVGLLRELYYARLTADQNFRTAGHQLQVVLDTIRSGQGSLQEELKKLAAQSLQPGPAVDEDSLAQRVLSQLTSQLPEAPQEIIRETHTEETTVVQKSIIDALTREVITIEDGGKLEFHDSSGTAFVTFGGSPKVTFADRSLVYINGQWFLNDAEVTASAEDLNKTSKLSSTTAGSEGTRQINTRAGNFSNFTPSRNDVEAVLVAIDAALGDTSSTSLTCLNCLDFSHLEDTLDLDAATELNLGAYDFTIDLDSTGEFAITDAGSTVFMVTEAGRVGIGTTDPRGTFDTVGASPSNRLKGLTGAPNFFIANDNGGSNLSINNTLGWITFGGYFNSASADNFLELAAIRGVYEGTGTERTGGLRFRTFNSGSNKDGLIINGAGNVGIGSVTNPDYNLTVLALDALTSQIGLRSVRASIVNGSVIGGIDFNSNDTNLSATGTTVAKIQAVATGTHTSSALNTGLAFTVTSGTTGAEAMRIIATGNVGIGTSTPAQKLDVAGTIRADTSSLGDVASDWFVGRHDNNASALTLGTVMPGTNHDYIRIRAVGSTNVGGGRSRALLIDANASNDLSSDQTTNAVVMINAHNSSATLSNATLFGVYNNGSEQFAITPSAFRMSGNVSIGSTSAPKTLSVPGAGGTSVTLGAGAAAAGDNTVSIGVNASAGGIRGTVIGAGSSDAGLADVIILGRGITATGTSRAIIGSSQGIGRLYLGKGDAHASPDAFRISPTAASGTDIAGANLTLAAGEATGSGTGGALIFATSTAGLSGTALRGATEKMRIDSNGNVGIGTSAPNATLSVGGTVAIMKAAGDGTILTLKDLDNKGGTIGIDATRNRMTLSAALIPGTLEFTGTGTNLEQRSDTAFIFKSRESTATSASFAFNNDTDTRLVTILEGGNVGIGTPSPQLLTHINSTADTDILRLQDSDGTCDHNPEAGSETVTCSSDERLKDNIKPAAPVLADLMKLQIRDYTVKASGNQMTGVIAQEVQQTHPHLVSVGSNNMLAVSQIGSWQIIKAIQELKAESDQQQESIAQLLPNTSAFEEIDAKFAALEVRIKQQEEGMKEIIEKQDEETKVSKAKVAGMEDTKNDQFPSLRQGYGRQAMTNDQSTASDSLFSLPDSLEFTDQETTIKNSLVVKVDATIYGTLIVDTIEIASALTVHGDTTLFGNLLAKGDVEVEGTLSLSGQQAGTITVPEQATEITVTFMNQFSSQPHITTTAEGDASPYTIVKKSTKEFTIRLAKPATSEFTISWLAIPIEGEGQAEVKIKKAETQSEEDNSDDNEDAAKEESESKDKASDDEGEDQDKAESESEDDSSEEETQEEDANEESSAREGSDGSSSPSI